MNTFGNRFRISVFGESHGQVVGVLIDGCPPGIKISEEDFVSDLLRRKPGKKGTTSRLEEDKPLLKSGIFKGYTTGSPVLIEFENKNIKSKDYSNLLTQPRPGHADFVAKQKYKGYNDYRGGGHFSGRLTLALVAAGVIAKKIIKNIDIKAKLISAGGSANIDEIVESAVKSGDSIGGVVECRAKNIPVGLGEPFFYSIESVISALAFSIPGIKAIEFGAGFKSAEMKGSEFNDLIINKEGETKTNNSGGINGGISNGNDIIFRVAVRPAASIAKSQMTFDFEKNEISELKIKGRHDACIALRVPVIIEAITAIALADFSL